MLDTSSSSKSSNEYEEPHGKAVSAMNKREGKRDASSESLEDQIDKRANEISRRGGGHSHQSLASWLEAAREILSHDSDPSH